MSTLQWNLPLSRAAIAAECNQSARVENGAHKDNDKRPLGNTTPDACAHTGSCNPIFQRCTFHLTFQIFACEPNSERAQTIAIPFLRRDSQEFFKSQRHRMSLTHLPRRSSSRDR